MPELPSTDRGVAGLPLASPRVDYFDSRTPGLVLRVGSRSKSWRVRVTLHRRREWVPLGDYPLVGLAEARRKAVQAIAEAQSGVRPAQQEEAAEKRELRRERRLGDVMERWLDTHVAGLTRNGREGYYPARRDLIPALGDRLLREVTRADIREVADRAFAEHGGKTAKRAVAVTASAFFAWAVEQDLIDFNPIRGLADRMSPKPIRQRVLTDAEIAAMLDALDRIAATVRGARSPARALRLLLLTGARRNEITRMRVSEWDPHERALLLGGEEGRGKRGGDLLLPLSTQAVAIIEEQLKFARGGWFFPPRIGHERPSDAYVAGTWAKVRKAVPSLRDAVIHDLRRTHRTTLSRLGVPRDVAEMAIGHALPGLDRVYDRHARLDERREAAQRFGDFVDGLRTRVAIRVAS